MKYIIELGDFGRSYVTENEEAADAIEKVIKGESFNGFYQDDYNELSPEARKVFDNFAEDEEFWETPYDGIKWDETIRREYANAGHHFENESDYEFELDCWGYTKWHPEVR